MKENSRDRTKLSSAKAGLFCLSMKPPRRVQDPNKHKMDTEPTK